MNYIDLRTGYIVSAFPDFESAFAATEEYCRRGFKVAYLNEVSCIKALEVEEFVLKHESQQACCYHNYHVSLIGTTKKNAIESLASALELLEQKNKQKAKFVMVVAPRRVKWQKHQVATP